MIWIHMASAETGQYSGCLGCKNHILLMPAPPQRPVGVSSRLHTCQAPQILNVQRRVSGGAYTFDNRPAASRAYSLGSGCNNGALSVSLSPSLAVHTRSSWGTKSEQDLSVRTFVFQRPVSGHRPYQKLESLCLRSKGVDQRPYSSLYRHPPSPPTVSFAKTDGVMTSSLVDQFPLPSANGSPADVSPSRPSSVTVKPHSDSTKPSLITNSFLRPTSAKVPLHPQQANKKAKSLCLVGTNSALLHNNGTDLGQINGSVQYLSNQYTTTPKCPHPPTSPIIPQGSGRMEPAAWQILELNSKAEPLASRDVHLTEAVRHLVQNRDVLKSSSAYHHEPTSKNACYETPMYINGNNEPASVHPACQKEFVPEQSASGGNYLNPSINSATGGVVCMKSSDGDRPNVHHLQTISAPTLTRESLQPAMLERSQGVNIIVMATQISTIHLDKTRRAQDVQVQPNTISLEPETPLPNCEPECAEEELPDGLEDEQEEEDLDEEDGENEDSSSIYVSSDTALSTISRQCAEVVPMGGDSVTRPALINSLFPNMPQTIYFCTPNEKENNDWVGCWGHHMKSAAFKSIRGYQKLNHFPGTFQIGRKDRLWRNLSKMQARFGKKEFNFFPQSFVLPQDIKLLKKAWEEGGTRQKWIVKPPASARGTGIQVIHRWSQLPKRRPLLVQRYLHKPYLIDGSKFDLRIYVYVTSYDPLRIYLFSDGLVRFASCKYSSSLKSLSNKFMHLTNYSVNKKNADYQANSDQAACQGHKWALKALWSYLNQHGYSSDKIWDKIKDMVIKTIIASEPYVNSLVKMHVQKPYSCHELFGFDIMLDENLKPWVLEVNISPSLHSNSQLDINIKGQMVRDLFNLAGFILPSREDMLSDDASAGGFTSSVTSLGKERGRSAEVVSAEKMKRAHYLSARMPDKDLYATVLDRLTPEDVRVLAETEDELSRCGQFERIFPTPISSRYLRFFEQPRYFNILINQWEQKYYANKEMGRDLLHRFCLVNFHTGSSLNPKGWSLPKSGQSELHWNGCSKAEVIKHKKVPLASEEHLKSSTVTLQHTDLCERRRLSQTLSGVPESTLVM
uniref:Tubulin polyglutamylase TTLL4 n=1 Tax=Leptobrachium leishanense TaxID=445787 RepID=A0A8C5Q1B7_9ANUR